MDKRNPASQINEAVLEAIFESAPDAILVVNHEGKIVGANKRAGEIFGYKSRELLNETIEILVPDRFKKNHIEQRKNYQKNPHLRQMNSGLGLTGRRKDGSEFPVDIMLNPVTILSDSLTIAIVRDLSERNIRI